MNSTPNTFFLQTFKVRGYALAVTAIVISFLFGYMISDIMGEVGGEDQAVSKDKIVFSRPGPDQKHPLAVFTFEKPEGIDFAGEEVPLHIPDVWERLDYELHLNAYFHSSSIALIKKAHRWLPQIEKILRQHGIPEDFKYLPLIESGLENVVSFRQAVGYWQLRESTGKELGLEVNKEVDERYDPLKSTEAACKYLSKAYEKFGSWTLAAASYNMGMSGLSESIGAQGVNSYYDLLLNEETARYIYRLLAIKEIVEHPMKYGYDIPRSHLYRRIPTQTVEVDEDIRDLATFAKEQGINYKILKRFNPWLRKPELHVKKGQIYKLQIPVDKEGMMTSY